MLGLEFTSALCTAAPTSISLAPLLRVISKPTTACVERGKAAWFGHGVFYGGDLVQAHAAAIGQGQFHARSSSTVPTVAGVRMGCSEPPRSARPPAALGLHLAQLARHVGRRWRPGLQLEAGPAPCTSRLTPTTRTTEPTPRTPSRARVMVLSTNQLRAFVVHLA